MTCAPSPSVFHSVGQSQTKHGVKCMKSYSNSTLDRETAYRMWFRDLLWRAFPASSDAARAESAARVLDVSERQVRNWLRCEHDPKLRYVMAVMAIAGAEVVFK